MNISRLPFLKEKKLRLCDIKTIDAHAKEWFDRSAGNSYVSVWVTLNKGMKNELSYGIPYQYGYGDYYKQAVATSLGFYCISDFYNFCENHYIGYKDEFIGGKFIIEKAYCTPNKVDKIITLNKDKTLSFEGMTKTEFNSYKSFFNPQKLQKKRVFRYHKDENCKKKEIIEWGLE